MVFLMEANTIPRVTVFATSRSACCPFGVYNPPTVLSPNAFSKPIWAIDNAPPPTIHSHPQLPL
jgi:hypothetical protein